MPIGRKSQDSLQEISDSRAVSIYQNGELTTKNISNQITRLMKAFPDLPTGYYDILTERLKENEFTDQRLKDAVDNVIDTCTYFKPTIADVISFDVKKEITPPAYKKIKS